MILQGIDLVGLLELLFSGSGSDLETRLMAVRITRWARPRTTYPQDVIEFGFANHLYALYER